MPRTPLTLDTAPEIERVQIEQWRRMSAAEKAGLVSSLTRTVFELARAGIRRRHPDASAREQFLRMAILMHGIDVARKIYPDELDRLDPR